MPSPFELAAKMLHCFKSAKKQIGAYAYSIMFKFSIMWRLATCFLSGKACGDDKIQEANMNEYVNVKIGLNLCCINYG